MNIDLALNKKASQSSIRYDFAAQRAVDGNNATSMDQQSCSHTDPNDRKPWWEVDFGYTYKVNGVEITNRGDCCGYRLKNFNVTVDGNL